MAGPDPFSHSRPPLVRAPSLRDRLLERGIPAEQVEAEIFRHVYSPLARLAWRVHLLLGADPQGAVQGFLAECARARDVDEVNEACREYARSLPGSKSFLMQPKRKRARRYFRKVMGLVKLPRP